MNTISIILTATVVSIILGHWSLFCESFSSKNPVKVSAVSRTSSIDHQEQRRRQLFLPTLNAHNEPFQDWATDTSGRTDVRNLLTQRSIQSFMFLCVIKRNNQSLLNVKNKLSLIWFLSCLDAK
ncbi:MAG: hypothetical protein ACI8RD_012048 [Bacillariaceae sp.]|jgi:hypothetical protein